MWGKLARKEDELLLVVGTMGTGKGEEMIINGNQCIVGGNNGDWGEERGRRGLKITCSVLLLCRYFAIKKKHVPSHEYRRHLFFTN